MTHNTRYRVSVSSLYRAAGGGLEKEGQRDRNAVTLNRTDTSFHRFSKHKLSDRADDIDDIDTSILPRGQKQ